MMFGTIAMADIIISFRCDDNNVAVYTVRDTVTGEEESISCGQETFLKALAIAVHNEGLPDWRKDYADAESIQGEIRWIP